MKTHQNKRQTLLKWGSITGQWNLNLKKEQCHTMKSFKEIYMLHYQKYDDFNSSSHYAHVGRGQREERSVRKGGFDLI